MKFVVVEEDEKTRDYIVKLLKTSHIHAVEVTTAENGSQGVVLVDLEKPDIIITDTCLKDMSGYDMLALLKKQGMKFETVIISQYRDYEYTRKALLAKARGYILRPIDALDFIQTVTRLAEEIEREY